MPAGVQGHSGTLVRTSAIFGTVLSLGAITMVIMAGCAKDQKPKQDPAPFSTKDMSTQADPAGMAALAVQAPDLSDAATIREASITLLTSAAESSNALVRANAIEALGSQPNVPTDAVRLGLGDDNRGVRFVATMVVGDAKLTELAPLVEPLLDDSSDSVRAAAIYALARCGRAVDRTPLATMAMSMNLEVRGNAVFILGQLGEPSAEGILRNVQTSRVARAPVNARRRVELQAAEALVKLGFEEEFDGIRAALYSADGGEEIAAVAAQMLGVLGDASYVPVLLDIALTEAGTRHPAEFRMAAAEAAAILDPRWLQPSVPLEYVGSENFALRAQAAHALGRMPTEESMQVLRRLLSDPNPVVQVSAAGGLLRLTRPGGRR